MNKAEKVSTKPSPEEIATLAYEIWQTGGCKPGTDMENWLQAEKQLKAPKRAATQTGPAETSTRTVATDVGNSKTNHLRRAAPKSIGADVTAIGR